MLQERNVNLPDSLEYIGKSAFAGTPVGETVHMPENLPTRRYGLGRNVQPRTTRQVLGRADDGLSERHAHNIGASVFRPDAKVIAVLNSQRNKVGGLHRSE